MIPDSVPEMSLIETWISAVTQPNESTFARIIAQPGATTGKALLWVFVASLITSFASLIAQTVSIGSQMGGLEQFLPPEITRELPTAVGGSAFGIGTVICGTPVIAILSVLGFAIGVALVQWVARLFGGTGSFEKLAYAYSAITVPYSVVAAVFALLGIIPIVGILTGLASFALSIYVLVLEVIAVKAVNNLDTGKAVGSVLLPGVVIFLLICCCFAIFAVALGPTIGDVFSEITNGLGGF